MHVVRPAPPYTARPVPPDLGPTRNQKRPERKQKDLDIVEKKLAKERERQAEHQTKVSELSAQIEN